MSEPKSGGLLIQVGEAFLLRNNEPASFRFHADARELFRIMPDGRVVLAEDVTPDAAARAFWGAVAALGRKSVDPATISSWLRRLHEAGVACSLDEIADRIDRGDFR